MNKIMDEKQKKVIQDETSVSEVTRTYCKTCGILLDAHDERINAVNRHLGVKEYKRKDGEVVPKVQCHYCHHDITQPGSTVTTKFQIGVSPGVKMPKPDWSLYPPPVLNDDEVVVTTQQS